MRPKDIVGAWVDAFSRADAEALAAFYEDNAINHQVAEEPVEGREAIREMFENGFARTEMVCIIENLFEDVACSPKTPANCRRVRHQEETDK